MSDPPSPTRKDKPELRRPEPEIPGLPELRLLDAYGDAIKGSLASRDSVAEKILGASFAIATALAAVIGLVAPKDERDPIVLALPFLLLAAAAVLALLALLKTLEPAEKATASQMIAPLKDVLKTKWRFAAGSVAALVLAVGLGAWTLADVYGPQTIQGKEHGTVVALTPQTGTDVITIVCPKATSGSVTGEIDLSTLEEDFVVIDVAPGDCQEAATTLRIPKAQVTAVLT